MTESQNRQALRTPLETWERGLAIAAAVLFGVSSLFPTVAAFVKDTNSWPKWWGVLDVTIAFVLAILAMAVLALSNGKINNPIEAVTYRAYRVLIHSVFAMLLAFVLIGDSVAWNNCLTGFAWRFWLLMYTLPAWFACFHQPGRLSDQAGYSTNVGLWFEVSAQRERIGSKADEAPK